jgi:hypothetical protein
MKLLILILTINCVYLFGRKIYDDEEVTGLYKELFGQKIYKNELRGMYTRELDRLIEETIEYKVGILYYEIIEKAKKGENEYSFTIMCSELGSGSACQPNGHDVWKQSHPNNILYITKSYITIEQIATTIIDRLNRTFPDSDITKIYKNCCDYYTIKW